MSKNTAFRVTNESSQGERRAVAENDRRVRRGGTYHEFAASEAGAIGGRFAAEARTHVVGSSSFAYPRQPGSAWGNQGAVVPPEEPLGVDINALEPLGTAAEIEQSLAQSRGG